MFEVNDRIVLKKDKDSNLVRHGVVYKVIKVPNREEINIVNAAMPIDIKTVRPYIFELEDDDKLN
jgi:hypothetical protein